MSPGQWAEEDQVRVYLGCSQEDRVVSNIQVLQFVESLHHQQQKERVEDSQDWDIHHRPDSGVGQQAQVLGQHDLDERNFEEVPFHG